MMRNPESGTFFIGRVTRHSLFFICMIGALLSVDAALFGGRYRADAWTTVQEGTVNHGRLFNLDVETWLRKALW